MMPMNAWVDDHLDIDYLMDVYETIEKNDSVANDLHHYMSYFISTMIEYIMDNMQMEFSDVEQIYYYNSYLEIRTDNVYSFNLSDPSSTNKINDFIDDRETQTAAAYHDWLQTNVGSWATDLLGFAYK